MSSTPRRIADTGSGHEEDTARQATDLAALRRMLIASSGTFSLSFVLCHDPNLRSTLLERLSSEHPRILTIRLPPQVPNVCAHVRAQLPEHLPEAIFILDLEASIPFEGETQATLRVLNSTREQWENFHCPMVFWLAEYGFTRLAQYAPDFWRYRSHQFEFVPETATVQPAMLEAYTGLAIADGLPFEEKLFRAAELEQRLMEAGDPPSSAVLPHALTWCYELARLLRHQNRLPDAERRLRKALHWATEAHGEESASVSTALSNLADLLQVTNHLAEAETLMRRAWKIDEASLGPDHPTVATDLNNLALLLQATNRLSEAEPLMRRALTIDEASYAPDHPTVAIRLNNLALLLQDTNRLSEAEPLMRRALTIDEASYGPDHPNVATALNNLALLLQDTNRLEQAEPLMRRALKIDEASYGPDHPTVARDLNNLAQLLQDTNRLEEAETLFRRALKIDEASFGPDHPEVATGLNNLARLYQYQGQLAAAEPLSRRMVGIFVLFRERTGHEHLHFRAAMGNYYGILTDLKLPEEEILERLRSLGALE